MPWLVAISKSHQQEVAREALKTRGIKSYFAKTKERVIGKREPKEVYTYGRYFFVKWKDNWDDEWINEVLHAEGVAHVFYYYDQKRQAVPNKVSDHEFYLKVKSCEVDGFIPPPKRGLRRGQKVRATTGHLKGKIGTVEQDEDIGRSRIAALFDFLGTERRVELTKGSLELIDISSHKALTRCEPGRLQP